jgi:hypothetical protein
MRTDVSRAAGNENLANAHVSSGRRPFNECRLS